MHRPTQPDEDTQAVRRTLHPCPRCHSARVKPTTATDVGAYYRCEHCGHIWHADSPFSIVNRPLNR